MRANKFRHIMKRLFMSIPIILAVLGFYFYTKVAKIDTSNTMRDGIMSPEFSTLEDGNIRNHLQKIGFPIANIVATEIAVDQQMPENRDHFVIRIYSFENAKNVSRYKFELSLDGNISLHIIESKVLCKEENGYIQCLYTFHIDKKQFLDTKIIRVTLNTQKNVLFSAINMTYIKEKIKEYDKERKSGLIYFNIDM